MTDPERAVIPDAALDAAMRGVRAYWQAQPENTPADDEHQREAMAAALAAASPLMGGAVDAHSIAAVIAPYFQEGYTARDAAEAVLRHLFRDPAAAPSAELVEKVRSALIPTGNTDRTRADYDLRCDICGRAHILDTVLPSEVWNQIAAPEAVLCTTCIDDRLVAKGLSAEAEFYFSGSALVSKLYATGKAEGNAEAGAEVAGLVEAARAVDGACRRWQITTGDHPPDLNTLGKAVTKLRAALTSMDRRA